EIIFLIRPTIMNDEVLIEQADRAMEYGERLRTGARNGLLPWSRERQTAQLNVQAEREAREGNSNKAMWNLRRSLELNPNQPDAIELKERLFDMREKWPSRSILERTINGEVEAMISRRHWPENWSPIDLGKGKGMALNASEQTLAEVAARNTRQPETQASSEQFGPMPWHVVADEAQTTSEPSMASASQSEQMTFEAGGETTMPVASFDTMDPMEQRYLVDQLNQWLTFFGLNLPYPDTAGPNSASFAGVEVEDD
ncbi:MAG: hypothetical protein AAFX05_08635, partial [Planctomycetota bacterium]